jgi:hypothetical protein
LRPGTVQSAGFSSPAAECVHATKEPVQAHAESVGQAAERVEALVNAPALKQQNVSDRESREHRKLLDPKAALAPQLFRRSAEETKLLAQVVWTIGGRGLGGCTHRRSPSI